MKTTLAVMLAAGAMHAAGAAPQPDSPAYRPDRELSGVIRTSGSDLAGLLNLWEAGFRKLQPNVRFENHLDSGDAAIGAVEAHAADVAVNGREPVLTEFLSFAEVF